MEERRRISRVDYNAKAVIVVCETQEQIVANVKNVSPLGMAVILPKEAPDIVGKDIIIVAETLIMYADVVRKEDLENGETLIGITAKKFSEGVLSYLFQHIAPNAK